MTVKIGRKSEENFENQKKVGTKMFLSSNTGLQQSTSSRGDTGCQEREQWQSRVSFQPENGFSSESLVCRTMRTAVGGDHHHQQKQQRYYQQNKNSSRLSSSSSSSSSSSILSLSSDKMLDKSIQKTIGILSRSKIARLFVKSSSSSSKSPRGGESCSHSSSSSSSHFKLSSPSMKSVPSSSTITSSSSPLYYNPDQQKPHSRTSATMPHHWASFGMILIAILMLSSFSTSSMVMCVPLGGIQDARGGGESRGVVVERATSGDGGVIGLSPSKIMQFTRKLQDQQQINEPVTIQTKEKIYLPSLLNGGGGETSSSSSHQQKNIIQSNYQLIKQQAAPSSTAEASIQKLPQFHKDITRSIIIENPEIGMEDSDEMDNEVGGGRGGGAMVQVASALGHGLIGNRGRDPVDEEDYNVDDGGDDDPMATLNNNGGAMINSADGSATDQSGQWETVIDPHLYLLTEWGASGSRSRSPYQKHKRQQQFSMFRQQRKRRNSGLGPSLSIVNNLDVLRQRLLLEIARRRMRQSHNQIIANEEILRKIGRR